MKKRGNLLKRQEVWERLRISKSQFYRLRQSDSTLPKPVYAGRVPLWDADEIDEYVSTMFEVRDAA